ncbi:hypothetical protein BaRGS_00018418 [Batillaria attramentaria]|uniref:Uncharacterized protein n=1 Tax=Batillaria attramentaria TaxID=370345 RepID=A0ABD0KTZ6_9CAEN
MADRVKTGGDFCSAISLLTGCLTGSQSELLLVNKQFENMKGSGLSVPSRRLTEVVGTLEATCVKNIDKLLVGKKVRASLIQVLQAEMKDSLFLCPGEICDLIGNVIRLFVRVRLNFTLKDTSSCFRRKVLEKKQKTGNL